MTTIKPPPSSNSHEAKRARVLDAAEHLMRAGGNAEFSMRELAQAASVSFATPFNQFGSKAGIMQALSARRIDAMIARFSSAPSGDVAFRVLMASDIAVNVLLDEPVVNRQVIGSLGTPTAEPGHVADHSRKLWMAALGDFSGIRSELADAARSCLADHLALAFRGCISFWVAGEISDAELPRKARSVASVLMLGFVQEQIRSNLEEILQH